MPSYRCPIRRVHTDGSTCTHKVGPSGRGAPDCPGVGGYEATCSCGETLKRQPIRAIVEEQRQSHLRRHEIYSRPTRTVSLPPMETKTNA